MSPIKLLVLDVDGVMTDGRIIYDSAGVESKNFHVRDGMGIAIARRFGIEVAVISGRHSDVTVARCKELGISRIMTGIGDKSKAFDELIAAVNVTEEECAFIGDDLNDKALLSRVGFSGCPADAVDDVKASVDAVMDNRGGFGAVRQFIEQILHRNGVWPDVLASFS